MDYVDQVCGPPTPHNCDTARTISYAMSEQLKAQLKAQISEAIKRLAEDRGATIGAVVAQADLMALECVVAEATASDRLVATLEEVAAIVVLFLGEAADSLEEHPEAPTSPNRSMAARVALGLGEGTQGKPLRGKRGNEGRIAALARWLGYQPASLFHSRSDGRSVFDALVDDIAEHLFRREVEHLVNVRRLAQRARRPPLESAMRVEWLARFERYYRIWASISGLRHDLEMALDSLQAGDHGDEELFIRKSLYFYARYLTELEDFVSQSGGLWVLPDTRTEDAIADSMWYLRKPIPCGEVNESILRLSFASSSELVLFMHLTYSSEHLQPILKIWRDWVASCHCMNPNRPRKDCDVHATIAWACFYMDALDQQWDFLADWYDLPRPGSTVDPVKQARRGYPALPPPLPSTKTV